MFPSLGQWTSLGRPGLILILVLGGLPAKVVKGADGESRFTLRISDRAGLRRFGYPIHTRLPGEAVEGARYRLEREGKVLPAQFRRVDIPGTKPFVTLDFNTSLGPLESQEFTVTTGPFVTASPEPKGGLTVETTPNGFRVANGSSLSYDIPQTLGGLFQSVKNVKLEFWKSGGMGLYVKTPGLGRPATEKGWKGRVTRSGPLAVALRFEGEVPAGKEGETLPSIVDLTFPSSKSWAEVRWAIQDPKGILPKMGADLRLQLDIEPTVVDFGANNTVYGFLRGREKMSLEAGSAVSPNPAGWVIRKGNTQGVTPFASSIPDAKAPAEGWAHIMDPMRCTALAVDGFGRGGARDEIRIQADGQVVVERTFAKSEPRELTFWMHFVNNPVQIGAVTSPQAMQSPLHAEWKRLP